MDLTLFRQISLCTGVLGLFMLVPLLAVARRRPASLWLALYLLSICFGALFDYYRGIHPAWIPGAAWANVNLGAFYYGYVRCIVGLGMGRRQIVHFMPLACYLSALLLSQMTGDGGAALFAQWEHSYWSTVAYQLLSACYVVAVLYRLEQHRQRVRASYSSTHERDLRWLTMLSWVLIALWAGWVLEAAKQGPWLGWFALERLAIFYFVGWYGLRQAVVFVPDLEPATVARDPAPAAEAPSPLPAPASSPAIAGIDEPEKYARSGMTDAARQLIGERLQRRMGQQRDYLESDLRLTELADRIGTTPQLLSQYLNHVLGMSFFDYVNGLRIAAVQDMMRDPAHAGSTLLQLAHAAGFNSKSTFNTAFKEITGLAPSHWRARLDDRTGGTGDAAVAARA